MIQKLVVIAKKLWASDVVERAVWTALEAGLLVWSATGFSMNGASYGAVGGAMISALKTFLVNYFQGRKA